MDKTIGQLLKDLQGLRNEFNDFLYYLPDALLEVDLHLRRLTYMNRMAGVLFGYSEEDFSSGISLTQLFKGDEFERAVGIIKGYVARNLDQKTEYTRSGRTELYEFSMCRKDGSVFPAETQTSFVLDQSHVPIAMRTIVRDITDRKRAARLSMESSAINELRAGLEEIVRCAEGLESNAASQALKAELAHKIASRARGLIQNQMRVSAD